MLCYKLDHEYYPFSSCPDCEKEKKKKGGERFESLFLEPILYVPPPLLERPESWASREARKIMGPSDAERLERMMDSRVMEHDLCGGITWVGPR